MRYKSTKKKENKMLSRELNIKGMTCHHCVMSLREALSKIPELNVEEVKIGSAWIKYEPGQVTEEQLKSAVSDAGYELVSFN
jgi:copper chaperone